MAKLAKDKRNQTLEIFNQSDIDLISRFVKKYQLEEGVYAKVESVVSNKDNVKSTVNTKDFKDYLVTTVLHSVINNIEFYCRKSSFALTNYKATLIKRIQSKFTPNDEDIFNICYAIIYEAYISLPSPDGLEPELYNLVYFVRSKYKSLDSEAGMLSNIVQNYHVWLMKYLFNHPAIESIAIVEETSQKVTEVSSDIQQTIERWDNSLSQREEKIEAMEARLKDAETGFNFVGLTKAFIGLAFDKKKEIQNVEDSVRFWRSIAFIMPLITILIGAFASNVGWQVLAPMASMILISLYFYRVSITDLKSLRAQLVQLELRKALCQFVEKYTEYSSEVKDKNFNPLQKFEDLVFSSIVMDGQNIPSTFDGVDQISKFLKQLKA